eukprot:Pgem_evm1s7233
MTGYYTSFITFNAYNSSKKSFNFKLWYSTVYQQLLDNHSKDPVVVENRKNSDFTKINNLNFERKENEIEGQQTPNSPSNKENKIKQLNKSLQQQTFPLEYHKKSKKKNNNKESETKPQRKSEKEKSKKPKFQERDFTEYLNFIIHNTKSQNKENETRQHHLKEISKHLNVFVNKEKPGNHEKGFASTNENTNAIPIHPIHEGIQNMKHIEPIETTEKKRAFAKGNIHTNTYADVILLEQQLIDLKSLSSIDVNQGNLLFLYKNRYIIDFKFNY